MRRPKRRKITINDSKASILIGMVAFVLSFLLQMLFVYKWSYFRYAAEEFRIMAMGADASGFSWNALTSDVSSGGVFYLPVLKLLFSLGASGNAVYRVMRWIMAFICAIPAYLTIRIAVGYYGLEKKTAFLLGMVSVAAGLVRATSLRTENLLVLFTWIAAYELIKYSFASKRIWRIVHSIVASLAISFPVLADIRTFVILPALIITVLVFRLRMKRWVIDPIVSVIVLTASLLIGSFVIDHIVVTYSAGQEWETSLFKIWGGYFYDIARGAQRLHMSHAIRGLFDILFSNIWMTAVFSCGVIMIGFVGVIEVVRNKKSHAFGIDPVLFLLGIATFLAIAVYSLISLKTGIFIHLHDDSPNNKLFDIGYYGYLLVPMLIMEMIKLVKYGRETFNTLISSMIIIIASGIYMIVSVIIPALQNGHASMKWWFGYETSFLVMLNQWADKDTGIWFFIFPTVIILFLMWCYHKSSEFKTAISLMLLVAVVQYGYIEYYWASKADYRGSYDTFIYYVNEGVLNTADITDVYIDSDAQTAYSMQMALPELTIHVGVPEELSRNMIILSPDTSYSVCRKYHLTGGYRATYLDGNENLITNDDYVVGLLRDNQFVYRADDRSSEYVSYLYQTIFGREADPEGLNSWSYQLIGGDVEPSDIILAFLRSEEFGNRDLSNKQIADIMCRAFWGRGANKVVIHEICDRLDHGENTDDVAPYFMNDDRFASMLRGYGLHDNDADYVDGFIRRTYLTCMGRGADESGLEFFGEQIRNGEMSPMELVNTLIASEEYTDKGYSTAHTVISIYILYTGTYPDMNIVNSYAEQIDSGTMTYEDLEERLEGTMAYREMIRDYNLDEYI